MKIKLEFTRNVGHRTLVVVGFASCQSTRAVRPTRVTDHGGVLVGHCSTMQANGFHDPARIVGENGSGVARGFTSA